MIAHPTQVRVRYADTDQMGYVYYGKYAEYFEVGRVELIRSLGLSYKEIENAGYLMPVINFSIQYKWPAVYDEVLTIFTRVPTKPQARFLTTYEVRNDQQRLIAEGQVVLVFIDRNKNRPVKIPIFIAEAIEAHWKD